MNGRRIVAAVVGALVGCTTVICSGTSAVAGAPVTAHASVGITYTSTSFSVCYDGRLDDGAATNGTWQLVINGARSDGSPIQQTTVFFAEAVGPACVGIPKSGAAAGAFVVTLSFATVGTSSPNTVPDFVALAGGDGAWDPDTNPSADSFGT